MSQKEAQYFIVEWAQEDDGGRPRLLRSDNRERFDPSTSFEITEAGVLILDDGVTRTHWNCTTWVKVEEILET